jgi:hypothetical protein
VEAGCFDLFAGLLALRRSAEHHAAYHHREETSDLVPVLIHNEFSLGLCGKLKRWRESYHNNRIMCRSQMLNEEGIATTKG